MIFEKEWAFPRKQRESSWKKPWKVLLLVCGIGIAHVLGGCAWIGDVFGDGAPKIPEKPVYVDGEPVIRPGLKLRIIVTAAGMSALYDVEQDVDVKGELTMQLIGSVKCEGLTLLELQDKLTDAYKDFILNPQVTVNFVYNQADLGAKSPWGEVLVLGAVGRPGPVNIPSTREMKLTRVLMLSAGITPLGNKSRVWVYQRKKDGTIKKTKVNFNRIADTGDTELDPTLRAGDVVFVPETWY